MRGIRRGIGYSPGELGRIRVDELDTAGFDLTKPSSGLYLTTTLSQNINAAATNNLIQWDTQATTWGADLEHSTARSSQNITILTAGIYEISASLAFNAQSSTSQDYNGIARLRLNNSTDFGPQAKCGYISDVTGHDESSLHIQTFPYSFSASDYISLKVDRESSVTTAINLNPGCSALYIRRIQ